jgi:hypothetical protein
VKPEQQTEYIVQALREGGSMYEEDARKFLAEHDAHVLAGADLLPKADVVAWLTKKAREETPVWQLASKVDRGAVRPDNLRMLPAAFFEAGRTYTDGTGYSAPEVTTVFRVIGWSRSGEPGASWHGDFRDEGEFDGWTDVTEAAE